MPRAGRSTRQRGLGAATTARRWPALRGALLAGLVLAGCSRGGSRPTPAPPLTAPVAEAATYVGAAACADCHPSETRAWSTSHHRAAMQPATEATVLGNFRDAGFTFEGTSSTLLHPDGGFAVRTDGPDGKRAEFPVRYTLGIEPLQQYLVEGTGSRLQALAIAWDTRPLAEGGQRWFHPDPEETPGDGRHPPHSTGHWQGSTHGCGACHATNFQKNYRAQDERFESTFSEVNVACEACHGPASRHVAWARSGASAADKLKGLLFALQGASLGSWGKAGTRGTLTRTGPISRVEMETCGGCHSRRAQIWPGLQPGAPIGQTYRVALLDEGLYEPDGQMLDEVYEYGSFLQSSMFQSGVTCSDCHEPHAAKLRAEGNAVCTRCHLAPSFETPRHHHHSPGSAGAECVSCHMSMRTYRVLDGRRDHSFRIPRPDVALRIGTPDACTTCHRDKGVRWSAQKALALWGPPLARRAEWGEALAAGRRWLPGAADQLTATAEEASLPGIVRATAVGLLENYPDPELAPLLERWTADPDPLLRRATAHALAGLEPPVRARVAAPLLSDPVRDVRLEAAVTMASVPPGLLDAATRAAWQKALAEERASLAADADESGARYKLGLLELALGHPTQAEAAFRSAIQAEPTHGPAYLGLADVLRGTGRDAEAEATLRGALLSDPGDAAVYHALGLSLVRQGRKAEALPFLEKAAQLGGANPRFVYVYADALRDAGDHRGALHVLERAVVRFPGNIEILAFLVRLHRDAGDVQGARRWARKLGAAAPKTAEVQQLVRSVVEEGH